MIMHSLLLVTLFGATALARSTVVVTDIIVTTPEAPSPVAAPTTFQTSASSSSSSSTPSSTSSASDLYITIWTGSECTEADSVDPGSQTILMYYGQNNPIPMRSYNLSRNLLPNEHLDWSNSDDNESGTHLNMAGLDQWWACQAFLGTAEDQWRTMGCNTIASPLLYVGCVNLWKD